MFSVNKLVINRCDLKCKFNCTDWQVQSHPFWVAVYSFMLVDYDFN